MPRTAKTTRAPKIAAPELPPVTVELERKELLLMIRMIKERISQASEAGIDPDHPSSLFRIKLLEKLLKVLCDTAVAPRQ